jgi:hypothetical protein
MAEGPGHTDSVELEYIGAKAKAHGPLTVIVLLLVAFMLMQGYLFLQAFQHLESQHESIIAEFRIQTWILAQPVEERPALVMPEGLVQRLLNHPLPPPQKH